jgi:hypothetical protein
MMSGIMSSIATYTRPSRKMSFVLRRPPHTTTIISHNPHDVLTVSAVVEVYTLSAQWFAISEQPYKRRHAC